jgi:hypothetical protein
LRGVIAEIDYSQRQVGRHRVRQPKGVAADLQHADQINKFTHALNMGVEEKRMNEKSLF